MARGTKGQHCTRYKRVRVKGQGMSKRCAGFAGSSLGRHRRRRRKRR